MPSTSKTVLIVHPDTRVADRFRRYIADSQSVASIQCLRKFPTDGGGNPVYDLIIAHENCPVSGGSSYLEYLIQNPPVEPVILISGGGSVRRAVQAVRAGVKDYLLENADAELVQAALANALETRTAGEDLDAGLAPGEVSRPIITRAKSMQRLLAVADRIADAPATVLIRGESGTGKELLARYIHDKSSRRKRPFVAMNCAALPENLAESELFGYEKGAFTGAVRNKAGKFEQANMSSLLLDEISEMPLALQVKLLRVLQEKEVDHIGGKAPIPVDTRIIATTNRNLAKMVKAGAFREDLFYRLRVVPLTIPPLRERPEDIALLARHFIDKHRPPHFEQSPDLSAEALEELSAWPWPGNVRELENTMERAVLISDGITIKPDALLLDDEMAALSPAQTPALVGSTVREMERQLIGDTLDHVNQNRTHAAKMLGISIRTLRNKLKEYQELSTDPGQVAAADVGSS